MVEFFFASSVMLSVGVVLIVLEMQSEHSKADLKKEVHRISFSGRKLIIDDFFIIASFREGSLNCSIFEYLDGNKNRKVSLVELEKNVFKGREIIFYKIVDNMGFKSDLKKVLFTIESDYIIYHPEKINSMSNLKVN